MPRKHTRAVTASIAAVPVALGLLAPATASLGGATTAHATRRAAKSKTAKEFSIPLPDLKTWAGAVVVTMNGVKIEGHSPVHAPDSDCEMHFGAHSASFQGNPDGLVLEPMNVCVVDFEQEAGETVATWPKFGDALKGATVMAEGVPRVWPEHLHGGSDSNPDHAVELHPLTALTYSPAPGTSVTKRFSNDIFEGEYKGGVGETTAFSILDNVAVDVARHGASVDVSFFGGTIGNFTVLDLEIDRASIAGDGAGSFRMTGAIVTDDSTVPVRIVSIKGTAVNDAIGKLRTGTAARVSLQALVLFSLSPEALLDAANKSNGKAESVDRPIQLIVFGTPDDR